VTEKPADAMAGSGPIDPRTVRALVDAQLEAVLLGRTKIKRFRDWWDRHARSGFLGRLTQVNDPRGREAVDLAQAALDARRHRRIDEAALRLRLRRALGVLRG
jgi:hypothetical protein